MRAFLKLVVVLAVVIGIGVGLLRAFDDHSTSNGLPSTVPTLGSARSSGDFVMGASGWGEVRPTEIFNGGDPTGLVLKITWSSWGGAQAIGHGTGYYEAPNASVAQSVATSATVVAFKEGLCDGRPAYLALEWYYPSKGAQFSKTAYETTCNGVGYSPGDNS